MSRIVCKFGGTSLADARQIRKVYQIVESDPRRSIVVPSAPGRRTPEEAKVTDLLYLCHEMAHVKADFSGPFTLVRERFLEIERDLGLNTGMEFELAELERHLVEGCSRDHAASRGEYLCGRLLAALLDASFVDPADFVVIRSSGLVDPASYERLGRAFADPGRRYVMPGFYGRDEQGNIRTFARGGSDISGAIAARAVGAELYENWTDVSGLLMADPQLVAEPAPLTEVTYREVRELSYMGARVFHDEAILPVREVGIPICIKNTNDPGHPGTRIVPRLSPEVEHSTEIAGIAGKKNFSMICVEKTLMNKQVGFAYRLLGILQQRSINVEHIPSSIDGINVIVEQSQLASTAGEVLEEIRRVLEPDSVTLEELALIAVVGEGMVRRVGIAAKVFSALRDARVNVRVIDQGASELSIIVGVSPEDFERAVTAIYRAFVPGSC